jgi:hypothetical protein
MKRVFFSTMSWQECIERHSCTLLGRVKIGMISWKPHWVIFVTILNVCTLIQPPHVWKFIT